MGDELTENVWEGEDEIILAGGDQSAEEYESAFDNDEMGSKEFQPETNLSNKKLKRKAKFDTFKSKKLRATTEEIVSTASVQTVGSSQLTVQAMMDLLEQNATHEHGISSFGPSNFFYPDFDDISSVQLPKVPCPFVRALSVSLPSYRKIILNINNYGSDDFGCPIILIICASAIRCTKIIRSISSKIPKCKIAKLFAKHMKIDDQMDFLSKSYYPIAIGTPNRISSLIEVGALSFRKLKVVLLDVTPDSKSFCLCSLPDTKKDLYKLLANEVTSEKGHLKISCVRDV
jgi:hypothetical protein